MSLLKRILFYGLMAALTLLAIEGMARAAYFLAFAEWYGGRTATDTILTHTPQLNRRMNRGGYNIPFTATPRLGPIMP